MKLTTQLLLSVPRTPDEVGKLAYLSRFPLLPLALLMVAIPLFIATAMALFIEPRGISTFQFIAGLGFCALMIMALAAVRHTVSRLQHIHLPAERVEKVMAHRSNPDVEAYRLAVVQSGRPFLLADIDNMEAIWGRHQHQIARSTAAQKSREALAKLSRVDSSQPASSCV